MRDEGRAVLATLTRTIGDLGRAEDAVQDALVQALDAWARDGVPPNPRAWLLTAARHRAIDRARREARRSDKEAEAVGLLDRDPPDPTGSAVHDDLLRLVFTCCHPTLAPDTQVALALRTLCGLGTDEVARSLLVSEATMAKRLTRARQKIAVAKIPYRVPPDHELPDRLAAVATVAYLVFNEGYAATAGEDHLRPALAEEGIRLARLLVDLLPGEAGLQGLLALMLLQHARRDARLDPGGGLVLIADQDRGRWDRTAIAEGVVLVGEGLRRSPDRPDPYVVQAAIAAAHDLAPTYADTDWAAIVSWYDVLLTATDTAVVRLNRAAAVAERDGAEPALALVDELDGLGRYPLWHGARAELLTRLDRPTEAAHALRAALALPLTAPVRRLLEARLAALAA
ncbi:sigma-70 family RNA polymerase sigma factor [Aquihabitans sp. G128]|uniref:RNA polymerase sigma factor n=1 Tax=Aquihabitans sp. G128 TaxID=2849779 RepID=UPI001C24CBEE|nr:sigma-70 family RNA polymerase sigma factor [Aquihabitans sp. G128]QXC61833.1 sigma-70 family RNA polymerase sigma factor [Aquihabitans sp. G128]